MIIFPPREKREGRAPDQRSRSSTPSTSKVKNGRSSEETVSNEPRPIAKTDLAHNGSSSQPEKFSAESIIDDEEMDNDDTDLYVWVDGQRAVIPRAKPVLGSQIKSKREEIAKNSLILAELNSRIRYLNDIVWPLQYLENNVHGEWFEKFGPLRTVMWWLDLRARKRLHLVIKIHLAFGIPCTDWSPDVDKNPELADGEEKVTPVTFEEARRLELKYEESMFGGAQILETPALDIPLAKLHLESLIVGNPTQPLFNMPIVNNGTSQPNNHIEGGSTVIRASGNDVKFSTYEELLSWTISRHHDRAVRHLFYYTGINQRFLRL